MTAGDLTDLSTCYAALGLDSSSATTDGILAKLITAISAYVPNVVNRNFLSATYSEIYVGTGKESLLLRQRPVTAIASVAWQGGGWSTPGDPVLGTTGVWTDGLSALLVNDVFPRFTPVRITYTAGFAVVPPDVSLAVAELVAEAYSRRNHVGETSHSIGNQTTLSFDAKSMHAAIADKLANYRHGAPC